MFKFSVHGQRVGRIAFGVVLIAGAGVFVHRLLTRRDPGSELVLLAAWAAAFAAYLVVGRIGSRRTLDHAGELAAPSLVLPSVGAALLMPLTLHLGVVSMLTHETRWFDDWALISLVVTGPTHLVLAGMVGHRAQQLASGVEAVSPRRIYVVCIAVSCLPFALLVLPPLLVALTGLPLAAMMFWMEPLALRDRERAQDEMLPRAVAVRSLPRRGA